MAEQRQVRIAVDVPLFGTFSYLTDLTLVDGQRVQVPFGPRKLCGIVANLIPGEGVDPSRLKPVLAVFDELPALPAEFLELIRFCASYYHYPFGQTLFTALPTAMRDAAPVRVRDERDWRLSAAGCREAGPAARQKARLALWQALLAGAQSTSMLRSITPQAGKWLSEWSDLGWVERVEAGGMECAVSDRPELTGEQQAALNAILGAGAGFAPWVLHGVTGSGKTEVYLRLIERELLAGRQALVLVPEINLTPQLLERFASRFPATRLAVLHSHLSDGERLNAWLDAWLGRAGIVIGTRLSVFVPLPRVGLIVVDEEHDGSFKQQDGLRYHARDLAIWRARRAGVPIVLGSATPSLETMSNVDAGRYRRIVLTQRAHAEARLPQVRLVDIRRMKRIEGLAEPALEALSGAVAQRQLSLVYINRRGFAPVVACGECGWTSGCSRCSAKLVVHLRERILRCHHCGWEEAVPKVCPTCGNVDIRPLGEGTQRLEAGLTRMIPGARVLRIDRDTTQHKQAWDEIYRKVQAGEVDILVGTQMLAKGHDFGAMSLVVVVNADGGLYSADYRASERLFAQLLQVAGRAGRAGTPGRVLVQTQWPDHPLYQALLTHDFDGYAAQLLRERREAGFPPACHQAMLRADARTLEEAEAFLKSVRACADAFAGEVRISGPAPALMVRLANRERAQLVFEVGQRPALHHFLNQLQSCVEELARRHGHGLRWSLDVDPQEM
ncbi:primosomal protein N' [Paludibacterium yongneupense]|uniref:primosomal protein N' n=1 Tax=Paludibacterium yongneupense TaxID=400061 RepID=UPI000428B830|nr:primosomal protein N' [Paludibacterium yongneupense]